MPPTGGKAASECGRQAQEEVRHSFAGVLQRGFVADWRQ